MSRNRDLASVLKAFDQIPKQARQTIRPAVARGVKEIAERVRYLAPEDEGDLKASVKDEVTSDVSGRVTVEDEAGMYVEYGTAKTDMQPFFWPAVNTTKTRVRRRIDRAISKAVKDTWGKK